MGERMAPLRSQLQEWFYKEYSLGEVWVRHGERGRADGELVNCHDVEVDYAVAILAGGVAMHRCAHHVLDALEQRQHLGRGNVADDCHGNVQEFVVALVAPRRRGDSIGAQRFGADETLKGAHGSRYVCLAVAQVCAYVYVVSHCALTVGLGLTLKKALLLCGNSNPETANLRSPGITENISHS